MKLRVTRSCDSLRSKSSVEQFTQKYPDAEKYLHVETEWEEFEQYGYACKREKKTLFIEVKTLEELFEFIKSVDGRVVLYEDEIEVYDTYRE